MPEAVFVEAVRTPIGRYGGALSSVRPDDLAASVIRELFRRRPEVSPDEVEDVVFGAANQAGEDNRNVARMASLLAGMPVEVAGQTVNRLCASGLSATITAVREVQAGAAGVMVAGGVESMSRAPYVMEKPAQAFSRSPQVFDTTLGWRFTNPALSALHAPLSMGETAEVVARRYGVSRADQDEFAYRSHQRALDAQASGAFDQELVAVDTGRAAGIVARDEGPRSDTSVEKLSGLKPVFVADGTVTAGNSSSINDGAAALLVMDRELAQQRGLPVLGRFVASAVAGVDPSCMGIGPVPATRKALGRAGWTVSDLDVVELNEAFASQSLACVRELGLDPDRVNPNGGAIALGHPLGCSGARLLTTLLHELRRRGGGRGLATMCVGVGQGVAVLVEATAG
ncbi:MAG: thiolase family protein [Candidatus Dormibacteria bacterium]